MMTESQIFTVLRSFLVGILPVGVEIIRGQGNRVAEPMAGNFVTMTPVMRERLSWNIDTYNADIEVLTFTALTVPTIGTILTNGTATAIGTVLATSATTVTIGTLNTAYFAAGDTISGVGTVASVAYSAKSVMQPTKITIQLDVHGVNSADNSQIISTLMRDTYAYDTMTTAGYDIAPLYAGDPHQMPFLNGEQQIEERWVVDIVLQANIIVDVSIQFMNKLAISGIIDVDATYPPV